MRKYLISYDLRAPGRNYDDLYEVLKSAPSWWHHLESTWVIYTNESIDSWQQKIKKVIDNNDYFIIIHIDDAEKNGWLPQKAWDWLNNNLG